MCSKKSALNSFFCFLILLVSSPVTAAPTAPGKGGEKASGVGGDEYTVWSSPLMSQSLKGFEKITTLYGATYGTRFTNFYEFSGYFAYLKDRNYVAGSVAIREENKVGNLTSVYYMGADLVTLKADGQSRITTLGAHFGGGMQIHLGYAFYFRPDIKFQFGQQYSVLLGLGLTFK